MHYSRSHEGGIWFTTKIDTRLVDGQERFFQNNQTPVLHLKSWISSFQCQWAWLSQIRMVSLRDSAHSFSTKRWLSYHYRFIRGFETTTQPVFLAQQLSDIIPPPCPNSSKENLLWSLKCPLTSPNPKNLPGLGDLHRHFSLQMSQSSTHISKQSPTNLFQLRRTLWFLRCLDFSGIISFSGKDHHPAGGIITGQLGQTMVKWCHYKPKNISIGATSKNQVYFKFGR